MQVLTLGAGQDIGKSCMLVTLADKTIMFDCGMHPGYSDSRKFPDFSFISKTNKFNEIIDFIIISHFHLDHSGALPYFTEVCGYSGPIYMTYPTKSVLPLLLEDYKKILEMKSKEGEVFTSTHIVQCMAKIIPINIEETYIREDGVEITPYYAGHVIGAAMFYVKYKDESIVYTGDYSTSSDKHLGAAKIATLRPNLMITESTYGNVIRDCRKSRERQFLQVVQDTIDRGGKILIPIFALGRAQELCLLLENYWERMELAVPLYFTGGLAERATEIYKKFINYTNQTVREKIISRNVFEFHAIKPFNYSCLKNTESSVIFASPAMLHSGNSLRIFKALCEDSKNSVILPGYCARDTVGDKILKGAKTVNIFGQNHTVKIEVHNIAFSAHADSFGIMKMIDQCKPENVMLVHGERNKMSNLKKRIEEKFKVNVYYPPNNSILDVPCNNLVPIKLPISLANKFIDFGSSKQKIDVSLEIKSTDGELTVTDIKKICKKE